MDDVRERLVEALNSHQANLNKQRQEWSLREQYMLDEITKISRALRLINENPEAEEIFKTISHAFY